ncbi:TauD/TfdA dioxygenase family protein [Qipengyuania sp. 902]|uniref:TauD/TfdA dioxygenase family protein n=1 Tax=Qipengyuania sp. 902 TaxID=3417565 RepID=UPI003EBB5CBA
MRLKVEPSGQACGARVTGLDLSRPIGPELAAEIRSAWLEHRVLAFPGRPANDDTLEAFSRAMGGFGEDPFFDPIEGR